MTASPIEEAINALQDVLQQAVDARQSRPWDPDDPDLVAHRLGEDIVREATLALAAALSEDALNYRREGRLQPFALINWQRGVVLGARVDGSLKDLTPELERIQMQRRTKR